MRGERLGYQVEKLRRIVGYGGLVGVVPDAISEVASAAQSVDQLFESVTDRQQAALRLALDEGYYEQPRQTSLRELAAQTSVARSTYEEHLRKAENKLLTNAGRFLRLLTTDSSVNPLQIDRGERAEQSAD